MRCISNQDDQTAHWNMNKPRWTPNGVCWYMQQWTFIFVAFFAGWQPRGLPNVYPVLAAADSGIMLSSHDHECDILVASWAQCSI